jgi:hypothetical protein
MAKPTAAQAVYPHLQSGERAERQQRGPSLADSMFPGLSREAKAKEADQQLWNKICRQQRDRAHLARERGRR